MNGDRIPPSSLEGEKVLIGSLMIAKDLIPVVLSTVRSEDFYAHTHGTIFQVVSSLYSAQKPVDLISVAEELRTRGQLERVGNVAYLRSLLDVVETASTAEYWAKVVAEKSALRQLIDAGRKIIELGFSGESDANKSLSEASSIVQAVIGGSLRGSSGQKLSDSLLDAWRILEAAATSDKRPGLTSPWPTLDQTTGGTFGGEMVVWAAGPGQGKTFAVTQLALHVARSHGAVALFALEMGTAGTTRRILGKASGISGRRIRMGEVKGRDWESISRGMEELSSVPLWLFDNYPRKTVHDVHAAILRLSQEQPVKSVFIDHANFLADATNYSAKTSKHERLDAVYMELLHIAREFDCVMHVVQHLNRAGMDSEPTLAHLRDGGNLEGHASVVVFPYRKDMALDPTRGEFIVAKNRENPLNRIAMDFDGQGQEWRENHELESAA